MALIKPIVPMEIKSSTPIPVLSNFFAMYTTKRKFLSIKSAFTATSLFSNRNKASASSSASRGGGKISEPPI